MINDDVKKINVLVSTATPDRCSKEVLSYFKQELNINKLYVVTGDWSEFDEYSQFDGCICQHDCRVGAYERYYDKYVDEYLAVDEKILNSYAQYMPELMHQMCRDEDPYRYQIDKSYMGRHRLAMNHLRFWYNFLLNNDIDYYLLLDSPHTAFDYAIYNLCKVIKTKSICVINDVLHARRYFVAKDLDEFGEIFKSAEKKVNELLESGIELKLSDDLEAELQEMSSGKAENMQAVIRGYSDTTTKITLRAYYGYSSFWDYLQFIFGYSYSRYIKKCSKFKAVIKTVRVAVPSAIEGLKRANIKYSRSVYKKTLKFFEEYDAVAVEADYDCKYVYYAFQYLPENSSNPLGGRLYADQSVPISIISAAIPDDWKVYVKVHPAQLGVVCTAEMMKDLLSIPKVVLVNRNTPTLELTRHAQAVSALTGHVSWEAQFMDVPALVFGITDLRYAPMSYYVRTNEECRQAINDIMVNPRKTNVEEIRKFLLVHDYYTFYFDKQKVVEGIKRVLEEYEK